MNDILHSITEKLKPALELRKQAVPVESLLQKLPPCKAFAVRFRGPGTHILAELKKSSPSKGLIRADFQPERLAGELEEAGAAALSVLTEPNYFGGSMETLRTVAHSRAIPCLRKDFIFDPYQIAEARSGGAAAVLLIAAMLQQTELIRLAEYAKSLGLDVLGEAHTEEEIRRIADSPADLIGVNARNLHTFSTDLSTSARLLARIPRDRIAIAESAIRTRDDLRRLAEAGADGFLIGETLMRADHPGDKLREFLA